MSQILSQSTVVTRKAHQCWGCARKFPAGSTLECIASTERGKATSTYWCPVCSEAFNRWCMHGDEVGFGDLRHEDPDEWEKVRLLVEAKP